MFNEAKSLHIGQGDPRHKYKLGDEGTESIPSEDRGMLVGEKPNTT